MRSKKLLIKKIIKDNFWNLVLMIMKSWNRSIQLEERSSWEFRDWKKVWGEEKAVWIIKKEVCTTAIQMKDKLDYMVIWIKPLKAPAIKKNFKLIKVYPLIILQIVILQKMVNSRKIKWKFKMFHNLRKTLWNQKRRIKMWVTNTHFK